MKPIINYLIQHMRNNNGILFILLSDGTRVEGVPKIIRLIYDIFNERIGPEIIFAAKNKQNEKVRKKD